MFHNTPSEGLKKKLSLNALSSTTLPTKGAWLNDANAVLSHFKDNITSKDEGTIKLLKQAHQIIIQSEAKIAAQENRIAALEAINTTDELTGITNRRGFMQAFNREIDRVNRDKSQGGLLIVMDLDNFKSINDTYGHQAGDMALQLVAKTLKSDIRTMDVAARLGGDEFVTLFVNTDRSQAAERAQFLIKKLNNLSFIWKGNEINVRASLGLKNYHRGAKIDNIFAAADGDMYENKKSSKEQKLERNKESNIH